MIVVIFVIPLETNCKKHIVTSRSTQEREMGELPVSIGSKKHGRKSWNY